jgi:hypothetical protein
MINDKANNMAYLLITFENPNTGSIKEAPVGFSWTIFFFGVFPSIFRGDWRWAAIQMVCAIFTMNLSSVIFMFIYNKLYIKDLIRAGYKAQSIYSDDMDATIDKIGIDIPLLEVP